jgi:transposase
LSWASSFGVVDRFGIEGTGCWGAGLARWLHTRGLVVIEVDRPNRRARRRYGKSDPVDARAAARAVQSGEATGTPKAGNGAVEANRTLQVPYRTAVKARSEAANQLHALVVTAPEPLRGRLHDLRLRELVEVAARLRPGPELDTPLEATKQALRLLARRYRQLDAETVELTRQLHTMVVAVAPGLLAEQGVGTHTAATLLVTAGDNPGRLDSESSFAHLCGVAPLDASSGKQQRHRLNRGGDRQANRALHTIAIVRMSHDPTTRAWLERSTRVPIADMPLPRIRSPSQRPGTARSSASGGRSEMWTIPTRFPLPEARWRLPLPGRRVRRFVRRCSVSSRLSAPRDCTYRGR